MTRSYLDSSVALHVLFPGGSVSARNWLTASPDAGDEIFSSTLLELELTRVVRREGLEVSLVRIVLDRVNTISIDDGVLRAAAAIEPHVRSLDAIHLATCRLLGPGPTLITHDAQLAAAAAVLGNTQPRSGRRPRRRLLTAQLPCRHGLVLTGRRVVDELSRGCRRPAECCGAPLHPEPGPQRLDRPGRGHRAGRADP